MIRYFIGCLFLIAILEGAASGESRPNIVILLADDLGYGELGCQGNRQIPTPHIDSLADDGVRFTNGYVTAPFCSASRAGLITGRYQTRFGYEFNPIGDRNEDPLAGLPHDQKTLADVLRSAGYVTALIGKWHLGGQARNHPLRRGFDEFFGFLHEGHYYLPQPYDGATTMLRRAVLPDGGRLGRWRRPDGRLLFSTHMGYNEPPYDANNPILRDGQPVVETAFLTDAFTREAVSFIDRNKTTPFFLLLSYNAVHSPLQAANPYVDRFSHIQDVHRRIFAGMLSNLDESVGAVLAKLEKEDIAENTLVFFLSDNGGPTRELTSSNAPLRGEKGTVYEGGLRVPFLIRWPGVAQKGIVDDRIVTSMDLFATSIAAAGAKAPRTQSIDGVDLAPFLKSHSTETIHEVVYWRTGNKTALRYRDWKLLRNPGRDGKAAWQLYHLAKDVSESNDLAETHSEQVDDLKRRWQVLNAEMMAPIWDPRRPRSSPPKVP